MNRLRSTALLVALSVLAVYGCSETAGPGSLEAELRVSADVAGTSIQTVVVEVSATDIAEPLIFNIERSGDTAAGTVTVPAGAARTFNVTGHDADGRRTHEGSETIDVDPGVNPTLAITLLPVEGEVPVEVYVGSVTVEVTPAFDTLDPGLTVQLTATITDANDQVIDASPAWATADPGIATVDTTGLVTAITSGTVQIAATYAGSMGLAEVHVTGSDSTTVGTCDSNHGQDVVDAINAARADSGLAAVVVDTRLVEAAEAHSTDMATNDFLSHTGSDGSTVSDRLLAAGYDSPSWFGEVIGAGYSTGQEAVDAWMASDDHRAILLAPEADHLGVGYAEGGTYGTYWTVDFGANDTHEATTDGCHPAI